MGLEGVTILLHPLFRHQPESANFSIASIRLTPTFNFESLAVDLAREYQQTYLSAVAFYVVQHIVSGAPVNRADKDIRLGFDEPAFEHPSNGWRNIVGYKDGHVVGLLIEGWKPKNKDSMKMSHP